MAKTNPVIYFEIPVNDLNRAENFYKTVFGFSFEREIIDHYEMTLFPFEDTRSGISGALAKGDVYKPSKEGVIIYFRTANIDLTLQKVLAQNGTILYPKTINENYGFIVAEFQDSEGNRIAIQEIIKK
ncbi:VOC family protein [Flavobacterium sp. Fl-318]|uniref:VOC family protein n=1 Tax=Flavobacterium cupriresistens TaxID=2893885 RepID=A0ABU4RBI1_9FLAO|nr:MULTISPECIES: VOC family protein [unclassified Flavobacterium]MDX6189953.1 VOC family protein [Flavobacterium sp. Fl-318]UFH42778.1 VOC family protein [Flavobacterium sp. F-323]